MISIWLDNGILYRSNEIVHPILKTSGLVVRRSYICTFSHHYHLLKMPQYKFTAAESLLQSGQVEAPSSSSTFEQQFNLAKQNKRRCLTPLLSRPVNSSAIRFLPESRCVCNKESYGVLRIVEEYWLF